MKINPSTKGVALGLVALLLLGACTAALPAEKAPAATSADPDVGTEPPTGAVADADLRTTTPTDTPTETPTETPTAEPTPGDEYEIVTLLPPDAIRAIDSPEFYALKEADEEYQAGELVLGVEFEGDARAYSVGMLSRREIVNDTVGGRPIAVTW
jgi:hypothetical protein